MEAKGYPKYAKIAKIAVKEAKLPTLLSGADPALNLLNKLRNFWKAQIYWES